LKNFFEEKPKEPGFFKKKPAKARPAETEKTQSDPKIKKSLDKKRFFFKMPAYDH
jgi:hypothetical protein